MYLVWLHKFFVQRNGLHGSMQSVSRLENTLVTGSVAVAVATPIMVVIAVAEHCCARCATARCRRRHGNVDHRCPDVHRGVDPEWRIRPRRHERRNIHRHNSRLFALFGAVFLGWEDPSGSGCVVAAGVVPRHDAAGFHPRERGAAAFRRATCWSFEYVAVERLELAWRCGLGD